MDLWTTYSPDHTIFSLWSPKADEVILHFYDQGNQGEILGTTKLKALGNGVWQKKIKGDLKGQYYTFQVKINGEWLGETPGIYARAVGVNGKRAMVVDLENTNPEGWTSDKGPSLASPNNAVIYEMHVRDFSIQAGSGIKNKGKFLALCETGTRTPENSSSGLDHLKELGITHVHLLPVFDFASIDESKPDDGQYNWGYDPLNYNVPEGSYSTDPFHAETRIREFKKMVKALHSKEIGVVMDVVYNHTFSFEGSNFNLEYPGYYYRFTKDGLPSNASGCGNETASEKEMMRKFMIESLSYWAKEYHIDGFRFDLMATHDIQTMNMIAKALKAINPDILLYGEGWTAGDSPLSSDLRALKSNMAQMPDFSAFSDEIRDGIKGSVFNDLDCGFVSGKEGMQESVKMGIVGCIMHPQIDYNKVNASKAPWAGKPWQAINYFSCHDNFTLYDKLAISRKDASEADRIKMDKLAATVVLTSQGISFIHSGSEFLRSKKGEHNSYNLPDNINQIDWSLKAIHQDVFHYYQKLISLRKAHPSFRMKTAEEVQKYLQFIRSENKLISYKLVNHANGDEWETIYVIFNSSTEPKSYLLDQTWKMALWNGEFDKYGIISGPVEIPPLSASILYRD